MNSCLLTLLLFSFFSKGILYSTVLLSKITNKLNTKYNYVKNEIKIIFVSNSKEGYTFTIAEQGTMNYSLSNKYKSLSDPKTNICEVYKKFNINLS